MVTSWEAGLAVVDWPNSFGYNMFLYPLSRMTGGVYYEHAHRLFGALVGLTTVFLTIHLFRVETRGWIKGLAGAATVLVIVQGILGGLRVTGRFTSSQIPEDMAPSLELALAHGVLGQVFLALLVALAVVTSGGWLTARATAERGAFIDRGLSRLLVGVLLVQLFLGALVRHFAWGVSLHVSLALIVAGLGMAAGFRAFAIHQQHAVLRRLGILLLAAFPIQIVLGVFALVVTSVAATGPGWLDVLVATAHQALGALILAASVSLACWSHRLLEVRPAENPQSVALT